MLDLSPWQMLALAIIVPPLLVIASALADQDSSPQKSRWRGGEQL